MLKSQALLLFLSLLLLLLLFLESIHSARVIYCTEEYLINRIIYVKWQYLESFNCEHTELLMFDRNA